MKILIADSHPEVQSALHILLSRVPEVTEVLEAGSLVTLIAKCMQTCPDLILFDLALGNPTYTHPRSLSEMMFVLHQLCPCSQLVVMSIEFEAEQEALKAGANGFISKTAPPDEVLTSIVEFLKNHS